MDTEKTPQGIESTPSTESTPRTESTPSTDTAQGAESASEREARERFARANGPHAARARAFEREIVHLAGLKRGSTSPGEREAAGYIAARLSELGARSRVELAPAHGGYWWPIGLLNAAGVLAATTALRWRSRAARALASALGALAAAAHWHDVSGGSHAFRRTALPMRETSNVIAELGASEAEATRTVLLIAHHDSAHTGLVFHPALPRIVPDRFPQLHARSNQTFPIMVLTWLGPALAAVGAALSSRRLLKLAAAFGTGSAAAMTDIGLRGVVPGANDNLSSVAVLFALARSLAQEPPPPGVRVVLLSTGSEESFMEGMRGFGERHFGRLPRERTDVLCLECVGGPNLIVLEGEGMLRMRMYPQAARTALDEAAHRAGIELGRGLKTVAATDALIALIAGYEVATLASVDYTNFPANYHWSSDTAENLDWQTIGEAIAVAESFVRGAATACSPRRSPSSASSCTRSPPSE
jgi:acetylornithine deacetylase/succinyl-diaminopimelate desuccinylase-like protein